ncbi:6-hydroxymethylpterin diphosphokinase MptE-like protein [Lederbergia citri]|uniref:DUF115 domain-containing protein n=1 Tax=Lederbergia citri TaxID=2833580 RepID=A0A942YH80_9BACI|nr:6-hydroxymethylpterin diphosphokinase MptE-like protein [Lederbergia citri]MBS4195499.1 DUF115 domain-containing protein [Lederbergia citri]
MFFDRNVKRIENRLQPYKLMLEKIKKDDELENYILDKTKTDNPTLKIEKNHKTLFLHSKYSPVEEAKTVIGEYERKVNEVEHIIFCGVGLGYHVEQLMSQYTNKTFSLIEYNPFVFLRFLESRSLDNIPFERMSFLYLPNEEITINTFIKTIVGIVGKESLIITLPSYTRLFKDETAIFYEIYKDALQLASSSITAKAAFGKRWILNSLMNLPTTLITPNIKEKKSFFKGKPIIIASAGPSLTDDIEHLKYIKENGLAYIFAVGSANKALLSNNIVPDAVITYDPQPNNVNVYKEMISAGRDNIPMIFGTSVGYETIENYKGPKFHVVTSVDTISNFYLERNANDSDVSDATTVALIAVQIAHFLEVKMIILTGQNLAFKSKRFYAQGVQYGNWSGEVREDKEGSNIITVQDVYGNPIQTSLGLNSMKKDFEDYLEANPKLRVINTTKGGAVIKGAPFLPIEKIINDELKEKVVDSLWFKTTERLQHPKVLNQVRKIERAVDKFYQDFGKCLILLRKMDEQKISKNFKQINQLFNKFNVDFEKLISNGFYQLFISTVVQVEHEQLNKIIRKNYTELDQIRKIEVIISVHTFFLQVVKEVFDEMIVHVKESLHQRLYELFDTNWKLYKHNDGVFHFEGKWEREKVIFNDYSSGKLTKKINKHIFSSSSTKGSKVIFRFKGTKLRIIAAEHAKFASNLKIIIDGKIKTFTTKVFTINENVLPNLQKIVLEVQGLSNKLHDVSIEMSKAEKFGFQGIQINPDGRIFHIDEVTSMEEMKVRNRIRCHLTGDLIEGIATITNIGEETTQQMPVYSTDVYGDFYLIKVFEDENGNSKYVCNRNLGINKVEYKMGYKSKEIIINEIPLMNSNKNEYGKVYCSSTHSNNYNTWSAFKAFNKKIMGVLNAWATKKGITHGWLEYEFNNPKVINCYSMLSQDPQNTHYNTLKRMPKSWVLEGWDGGKWILLDERSRVENWQYSQKKYFSFMNNISFKRYRFTFSENNGDTEFLSIGEIELV